MDLIAYVDHIFNLVDTLAAAKLGDVYQAIATGKEGDKRTEGGGFHHGSQEAFTHLGQLRVSNGVNLLNSRISCLTVGGGHEDGAVFLNGNVRAGFLGNGVDGLALGADELANLAGRHAHCGDARRERTHLIGGVNHLSHGFQDGKARIACLGQGVGKHRRRDAVEFGVQLQGGDEVGGTSNFEVHVTEGIFRTQNVGEGNIAGFALHFIRHQAHGNTGNGRFQRHAGVVQGQRGGTHGPHGCGAVGA